jgi:hypothetical protein
MKEPGDDVKGGAKSAHEGILPRSREREGVGAFQ